MSTAAAGLEAFRGLGASTGLRAFFAGVLADVLAGDLVAGVLIAGMTN
jgi:hypothetical protein